MVSDSGAGAVRVALLVSQLLTVATSWQDGRRQWGWQQQMILHTEEEQSRSETVIYLSLLSLSLSSPSLSSLRFSSSFPLDNLGQPVSVAVFPPSIHPSLHPSRLQHPLHLSNTHWLVWHWHSTCQSLCLPLPTCLSAIQSAHVWRSPAEKCTVSIITFNQITSCFFFWSFWRISKEHWHETLNHWSGNKFISSVNTDVWMATKMTSTTSEMSNYGCRNTADPLQSSFHTAASAAVWGAAICQSQPL